MRVLVVGNGGREHALGWKLSQSSLVTELFATRPNAGLASIATPVDVAPADVDGLVGVVEELDIGLTVVGPEAPLCAGLVDRLAERRRRAFGPSAAAAALEGSKAFAKALMDEANIPTAEYATFEAVEPALAWVRDFGRGVVVKADGLAAGKGVLMCPTAEEAEAALASILDDQQFGSAGARVVVEELLIGEEASFIGITDGTTVKPFASSQDHKRIGEGDTGLNTGGMGAYSPAPVVTPELEQELMATVLQPAVDTMRRRGTPFVGFLYAGIMVTEHGPKVLEFNARLGDPETQVLLPRLKTDLVTLMLAVLDGSLGEHQLSWESDHAMCVVLASEGYPVSSGKGDAISGLEEAAHVERATVFHAGTKADGGDVLVNGGRVLGVTGLGADLAAARDTAYAAVDAIAWPGMQCRRDIGWRAL